MSTDAQPAVARGSAFDVALLVVLVLVSFRLVDAVWNAFIYPLLPERWGSYFIPGQGLAGRNFGPFLADLARTALQALAALAVIRVARSKMTLR